MSEPRDNKNPDNLPEADADAPALPEGWLQVLSMDMDCLLYTSPSPRDS